MSKFVSAPVSGSGESGPAKKQTEADKIQTAWSQYSHVPSVAEMRRAALLAQEEYLVEVKYMNIVNMDISDISSDQIEKLASVATKKVWIFNMTPASQLGGILTSLQSRELLLCNMELSEADTRALVTAMSHHLKEVTLYPDVTLDLEALASYDGRGRCTLIEVSQNTRTKYRARLREWATQTSWTVTRDSEWKGLAMQRDTDRISQGSGNCAVI